MCISEQPCSSKRACPLRALPWQSYTAAALATTLTYAFEKRQSPCEGHPSKSLPSAAMLLVHMKSAMFVQKSMPPKRPPLTKQADQGRYTPSAPVNSLPASLVRPVVAATLFPLLCCRGRTRAASLCTRCSSSTSSSHSHCCRI